jgi:hypothetical protein
MRYMEISNLEDADLQVHGVLILYLLFATQ